MSRTVAGPNVDIHVTTESGHPFPGQTVTISGPGDVYSDPEMQTVITTVTTNEAGDAQFYAPPGVYTFTCTNADTIESVEVLGSELGDERAVRYVKTGTATLASGTHTVSDSSITANSIILLANQTVGGTPGAVYVSAKTASTSFVITSTSNSDTSVIKYYIVKY